MKSNIILSITFIAASIFIFQSCSKQSPKGRAPSLPATAYEYSLPANVFGIDNTPNDNPLTNDGVTLGRVLFYDTKLSINNNTACGSCHHQANGFADGANLSTGFEGNRTTRNSSTIVNVINQKSYFWDGRTDGLETMVLQPIRHQVEMGMEKAEILPKKLAAISYYPPLFEKAFGSTEITSAKISKAMSQFLRSMTSYSSKSDITNLNQSWGAGLDPRVTDAERRGAQIFLSSGCNSCHAGKNLRGANDEGTANIGLEMHYTDKGIGETNASMEGVFKIPSLRNVALTAPYMHDGRFTTLKDVINHYDHNVVDHPNLSPFLRNNSWGGGDNSPRKLNLTEQGKDDLVAFLTTLTDEQIIKDVKFSDPFTK